MFVGFTVATLEAFVIGKCLKHPLHKIGVDKVLYFPDARILCNQLRRGLNRCHPGLLFIGCVPENFFFFFGKPIQPALGGNGAGRARWVG